jgi:hypothetical protein
VGGSHCLDRLGGAFTGVNGKAQALAVLRGAFLTAMVYRCLPTVLSIFCSLT